MPWPSAHTLRAKVQRGLRSGLMYPSHVPCLKLYRRLQRAELAFFDVICPALSPLMTHRTSNIGRIGLLRFSGMTGCPPGVTAAPAARLSPPLMHRAPPPLLARRRIPVGPSPSRRHLNRRRSTPPPLALPALPAGRARRATSARRATTQRSQSRCPRCTSSLPSSTWPPGQRVRGRG